MMCEIFGEYIEVDTVTSKLIMSSNVKCKYFLKRNKKILMLEIPVVV